MRTETATVYRANGRRWFTFDAACRAHGRELLEPWFRQAKSDWGTIPDDLMARYWKAVDYLASRAKRARRAALASHRQENEHG